MAGRFQKLMTRQNGFRLLNYAGFNVGWLATVWGAGNGFPWLGPVFAAVYLTVHLYLCPNRTGEWRLLVWLAVLGTLLESGVQLLTALDIVKNIVNNTLIERDIDLASEQIEAGKSLALPLGQSQWFPSIAVQMMSVGEQSGELENMLQKIADTYEGEVESQIMAMTSMMEPLMILVMGLGVGFIVVSILLPIFEMNQMIR